MLTITKIVSNSFAKWAEIGNGQQYNSIGVHSTLEYEIELTIRYVEQNINSLQYCKAYY